MVTNLGMEKGVKIMPEKTLRVTKEAAEHSKVTRSLKAKLRDYFSTPTRQYLVSRDLLVRGTYRPDVSVFEKKPGRRPVLIQVHEVETETTINPAEAKAQWLPYSKLGVNFYLYVPKGNCDFARFLCERIGIEVKEFQYFYSVGRNIYIRRCS